MPSVGYACGRPDLVEREFGLGPADGQRTVDFVVLDDVGPVFDDPVSAGLLVVEEIAKVIGGVVERELSGLQFGDEMSAVGRGGGEDVVESSQPLFEFIDCSDGEFNRLMPIAAREPGSGLTQGLRQLRIREGANGVG